MLNWRARTLIQGIKNLLNDPNFGALAGELYQHGLINPRGDGSKPGEKDRTNPSYIDPGQFAAAFLDIVKGLPANTAVQAPAAPQQDPVAALKAAVDAKMPPQSGAGTRPGAASAPAARNDQIRNMLHGIIDRAKGDENAMHRVSGAYKRSAQLWSFIFALVIAVALNISAIDVAKSLWKQPIDTKAITALTDKLPQGQPAKDQLTKCQDQLTKCQDQSTKDQSTKDQSTKDQLPSLPPCLTSSRRFR